MLRSWLIRGAILAVLAAAGFAALSVHNRIRPEQVRASLIAVLETEFTNVDVQVDSARLRLFGGISVKDLRLTRHGESIPFFDAPAAVIYHDKQQLHRGQLVIRKIELDQPTIRVNRRADGTWDFEGLTKPAPVTDSPLPTVVLRKATVIVTDATAMIPTLEVRDIRFNLLNDPASELKFELQALAVTTECKLPYSLPIELTGSFSRTTREAGVRLTLPEIGCDKRLAELVGRYHPLAGEQLAAFAATATVRVAVTLGPNGLSHYDVQCELRDGRYETPAIPWKIEQLAARMSFQEGRFRIDNGSARIGGAQVQLNLKTLSLLELPANLAESPVDAAQALLERLDFQVQNLALDDTIHSLLPENVAELWDRFNPSGTVNLKMQFDRTRQGWQREATLEPVNLGVVYRKFRYPVTGVTGQIVATQDETGRDETRIDLHGVAGGQKVAIQGTVNGDGPDPAIDLKITGRNVPIDDRLFKALKPKYAAGLLKLNAVGRGDFSVVVRQQHNVNLCQNIFRIHLTDGVLKYAGFPYELSGIRGDVVIDVSVSDSTRPFQPGQPLTPEEDQDRIELHGFTARHGSGRITIDGENIPAATRGERKTVMRVRGQNCPLDEDFHAAITAIGGGEFWKELQPQGSLDIAANVEIAEHGDEPAADPAHPPPDQPFNMADLTLAVNFRGPTITPTSFPYELRELAGMARYQGGKLELGRLSGKHGESELRVAAAEIRTSDTAIWTNLGGIRVTPLVLDTALLDALPNKLRAGLKSLNPHGPMDLHIEHAVVDLPKVAVPASQLVQAGGTTTAHTPVMSQFGEPTVYWRGELRLAGAGMNTGISWSDLHGTIACTGRYNGDHLGSVLGDAWLDRAVIADQPVQDAKLTLRVPPQQPDPRHPGQFTPPVIEFPDLHGKLFHGTVGGEARVVLSEETGYRLWLTAANVRLDEIATHYGLGSEAELRGIAQGNFLLESRPHPITGEITVAGTGEVDIPTGRMYNLPIMLPLLKLLKLQAPDQTAFEEAHAKLELLGDQVTVKHLDLLGTAISLGGSGVVSTDGRNLRFECYTIWSQALHRLLNAPTGGELNGVLNSNLFKIEMVRRDGGPIDYKPRVLPAVTDPVRAMVERVRGRTQTRLTEMNATIRGVAPR